MVHVRNCIKLWALLQLFELSKIKSETIFTVDIIPGDEVFLNCSESSSIIIRSASVQNIGTCSSSKNACNLNRNDKELLKGCEGLSTCHINGSLLKSLCLWEDIHFNISYVCNHAYYNYVGCYIDDQKRLLKESHQDRNQAMTADICFGICTKSQTSYEHIFFGTQYGYECFCGDGQNLDSDPYYKRKDDCNLPCSDNKDEICGGNYRMSVYKIMTQTSIEQPCLHIDQKNTITNCSTDQLQKKSLCVKYDVSSTVKATDQHCRNRDKEFGNKLYEFCINTRRNGSCVYNLASLLTTELNVLPPTKKISIMYLCEDEFSTISSTLSKSITSSSTLSNYNNFSTSTFEYANVKKSKEASENNTGTIVGSVVGSVLLLCIIFIGICIGRRFMFCTKLEEKFRHNPETNDKLGNQNIAMPGAFSPVRHLQYEDLHTTSGSSTHNYSSTNIQLQNIDDKYDYAKTIETNKSKTFNDKTSTPTYVVLQNDTYNPNLDANNDEYAVVDPTAVSSFQQTPKTSTQSSENYMILDPSQTRIDRFKFANIGQAYELAKPINDTRCHKDDMYALSPEGTYDHSGITRHCKDQDTIYTHAVDNVYDSANRGVNIARKEDTYDHFYGKETVDEYDITMH
ncbi:uncharacterized protein [Mytilus edulis]|uniref:uncharacterized protein n=1 Tax=Mytilus edulis TaxID=6550 RepID=UPI0039EE5A5A